MGKPGFKSLNSLLWLQRSLMRVRWVYYAKFWGMSIHPTVRFSMTVKFDKTYPVGVHIGEESYVAFGAAILTHDMTRGLYRDTRIGRHCFIGARSIVLPGIVIGDDCVVAAGAVVSKNVPPRCVVAGNPAKVIQENIEVGPFGRFLSADAPAADAAR